MWCVMKKGTKILEVTVNKKTPRISGVRIAEMY